MKIHTNDFKNGIKQFGKEIDSKITFTSGGQTIELGKEQLNSITPHFESAILKSTMRQLDIDSNVEIPLETVINYQFGLKVGNEYEYLNYGNYVVYKVEKQEDTNSYKITCYDKMLYSMIPYESLGIEYPITIKDYLTAVCDKLGLSLKSDNFINNDKTIQSELYLDSEGNSLDYTFRDVLDEIAEATGSTICINEDTDELEVRYINNTGTQTTVEGTNISIENSDDEKIDLTLQGNTTQEGTPTPDAPQPINVVSGRQEVDIAGKNLYNINDVKERSSYFSIDDENYTTFTRNDSPSSTSYPIDYKKVSSLLETSTDYWIVIEIKEVSYTGTAPKIEFVSSYTGNNKGQFATAVEYKFDQLSNGQIIKAKITTRDSFDDCLTLSREIITYYTGSTSGNIVYRTSIFKEEPNIENFEYEPYKGQSYEINLGKNLWNYSINKSSATRLNSDIFSVQPNTTYTFNISASNIQIYNYYKDINKNDISNVGWKNLPFTYTTPSNCYYIQMLIRKSDNSNIEPTDLTNIQLEKGSTPTSYSPYKTPIELCKIGNYQDFIKKGTGKNLFSSAMEIGSINNTTGENATNDNGIRTIDYITVKPNTTYTIWNSRNYNVLIHEYGENKNYLQYTGNFNNPKSFTTTANTYYIRVRSATGEVQNNLNTNYMMVLGEYTSQTMPSYEPYGMYNKWYIEKNVGKVVLNGSESWQLRETNTNTIRLTCDTLTALNIKPQNKPYSNFFIGKLNNGEMSVIDTSAIAPRDSGNGFTIRFPISIATTVADFKTWLSTHNTIVYYVLATPTYTEITDSELIGQLNSVKLIEGLNNVSVSSGDLGSPIKITYTSELDTIDEEYLKDINVNFGEKFGKVNSIVLSRSAESDNIYLRDEESVLENGLCEIKIKDNQIMNNNDRYQFLPGLLETLDGLEYYINDFASPGIMYYNLCDKYKVKVGDNYYKCILFNDEVNVTQGLEENIFTEMPEETETDYTKSDKTDIRERQSYIIVDKQNARIDSVVQSVSTLNTRVDNQDGQILTLGTRLTQTETELTATITSLEEDGVSKVKNTIATLDDTGLSISTDTSKIKTTMTNNEFKITDSGGTSLAHFGYDEEEGISVARMDNITVENYLTTGNHRIEDYKEDGEERTGFFYIGG